MKIVTCSKNHFFDADKYNQCPVCNPKSAAKGEAYNVEPFAERTETLFTSERRRESIVFNQPSHMMVNNLQTSESNPAQGEITKQHTGEKESLAELVQKSGHFQGVNDEVKTMSAYGSSEPVVGWLVCTNGCYLGESFLLKSGQNYIGRSSVMDIALIQEASISRSKHAVIIFDPKSRTFFIQKGEGSGLVYLNDEIVLETRKLAAKDRVQIGDLNFLFIPLCDTDFTWDNYINQENK